MESDNLHEVLANLYNEMMPLASNMIAMAKGLGGLGALFYIALQVWAALSRAEPIDVYPLLRPLAIGLCIMFFPTLVLGTINSVLSPVVKGTHLILKEQVIDLRALQQKKDQLERQILANNPETAYLVSNEEFDNKIQELGWSISDLTSISTMYLERGMYDFKKSIRDGFRELLENVFHASALVIDTIRTFFLIVLSIFGPIAFAISIWSGFSSSLSQWLSRYISVYLWLPISDILSSILARIQTLIIGKDLERLTSSSTSTLDSFDTVYILFMIIGIVGYFTIPTLSSWIIQAGAGGNYTRNINQTALRTTNMAGAVSGSVGGNILGQLIKK
ncbi:MULTISPECIES: conjugative transposon protein TraJ [Myroides]|uniref:Conjugative transposon protein TraJ n=1 Tax=Myroides albus TaxID=2562892 RepID=A0A6I3LL77_9FLAO|nr:MULTISPECIES: conjugative transposon protein TraJ [Myroides]MTG99338.1 conjugative transposon protein TraJ [Myroides albus]MVX35496.1 conjugative transposon protein TraJ [Myroides sp. LoEW2-1]UVD79090.1 conjugative transposon protein TraJ [Myroides albus]